jgi:hypothetical protein
VCRRLAEDPAVDSIVGEVRWDVPIRVLAALHYLALRDGVDPWSEPHDALVEHRDWIARFVAEQNVQTNEVNRCFALLPAFLELARESGRRIDLLELGPSAGLNLLVDRYGYRYRNGAWGAADAKLVLTGDERREVPADLLAVELKIGRRGGIDLSPIDARTDEGMRLLTSFVWADQWHRLDRLRQAVEILRHDPPELVRGDYVELLPQVLAERDLDALTVVFQTASTFYLARDRYDQVRAALRDASKDAPLGWVSMQRWDEEEESGDGPPLEVALWPDHDGRVLARMGSHGEWLDYVG